MSIPVDENKKGYDFLRDVRQRVYRGELLAEAARRTGSRGVLPEFGIGEAIKGWTGQPLHEADRNDPVFMQNLQDVIAEQQAGTLNEGPLQSINPVNASINIGTENGKSPYEGSLGTNKETNEEFKLPDIKEQVTGQEVDVTPEEAPWSDKPNQTSADIDKAQKAVDLSNARKAWLEKTSRSPAAKAFGNSEEANEMRWQTHLANQQWRKDHNRNFSHGDYLK